MTARVDAQLRRELREIVELKWQAEGLCVERRYARAAKRIAAAEELARALAALSENSVVVARLQGQQARMLLSLVQARVMSTEPLPVAGNDKDPGAATEQAVELLLAAISVIRHRRAAGTLLRGTCHAAEVAHALVERDAMIAAGVLTAENGPVGLAQEVGEVAAVNIGGAALVALDICLQPSALMLLSDAHLVSAFGAFATYVCETLDLVAALPSDETKSTIIDFAHRCEYVVGTVMARVCAGSHDTIRTGGIPTQTLALVVEQLQPLCDAWAAQRCTPAVQRLLAPGALVFFAREKCQKMSEHRSMMEGQRKRCCAHCGAAEAVRGDFQACARCRRAFYCSREHQRAHWRAGHKAACCDGDHSAAATASALSEALPASKAVPSAAERRRAVP